MLRLALILGLLAGSAGAGDGPITALHPQIAASIGQAKTGAGYLEIVNNGATDDRLIGIEGDFPRVEIHVTTERDGVMSMGALDDGLVIPAGGSVALAPGGTHVMIMGLTKAFVAGQDVPLVLIFERAGRVPVTFSVVPREDLAPAKTMDGTGSMTHG